MKRMKKMIVSVVGAALLLVPLLFTQGGASGQEAAPAGQQVLTTAKTLEAPAEGEDSSSVFSAASESGGEIVLKGGAKTEKIISYPGVDPEKGGVAPLLAKARKSKINVVTWPGFQMMPGGVGSRIFVQIVKGAATGAIDSPMRIDKAPFKVAPGSLVYEFPKSVVLLWNNTNPLVTTWYNTPVARIKMKRFKKRVYMIVEMKVAALPAREKLDLYQNDLYFFFVEFEPGDFLPKKPITVVQEEEEKKLTDEEQMSETEKIESTLQK